MLTNYPVRFVDASRRCKTSASEKQDSLLPTATGSLLLTAIEVKVLVFFAPIS